MVDPLRLVDLLFILKFLLHLSEVLPGIFGINLEEAKISLRQVNFSQFPIFVLNGESLDICGVEDLLVLVDDLIDLGEGVRLVWLVAISHIIIGLVVLPQLYIVVVLHVVEVGIFILVTFAPRLLLFLEPGQLLVIINEVQIVLIIRFLLFLPLLLFLFLLLLLFLLLALLFLLFVVRVLLAICALVALGLLLIVHDEVAFVVIVVLLVLLALAGVGFLIFGLVLPSLVFLLLIWVHVNYNNLIYRTPAFKLNGVEKRAEEGECCFLINFIQFFIF